MSALDPYTVLGVKRDATREQVVKAYRKKAAKAHPDKPGGSAAEFHRVKLAYDILKDETRRAKFDATGDASETTPALNPDHGAIERIGQAIGVALGAPQDPSTYDLAKAVIDYLAKHASDISVQIGKVRTVNERCKKLRKRFKRKSGDGENVLDGVVAWHETQSAAMMAKFSKDLANVQRAIVIVSEYGFDADVMQRLMSQSAATGAAAYTTGTTGLWG